MKKWFNAKRIDEKSASIRIFDQIGESWFGESTTAKGFTDAVDEFGELTNLDVHINSPGGNVYDGLAIYNYLKRHSAKVTVYIDGIAASIASIIAMAGDEIVMPENATMFIHNPWTFGAGDAEALRKTADELDTIRASLLGIYMKRIGDNLTEEDVIAMMDRETLLTAEEAVTYGLADRLEEASKLAAVVNGESVVALAKAQAEFELEKAGLVAKIERLEQERNDASESFDELQALYEEQEAVLAARPAPLRPMPPTEVIEACLEAKVPEWLATYCITNDAPAIDVAMRIEEYAAIQDACAAAGIDGYDEICREHYGDNAALISALLVEAGAAADQGINNRVPVDAPEGGETNALDYTAVYAKRKPQS